MKRLLLLLLTGLLAAAVTHVAVYAWRRPQVETHLAGDLAWLRQEFTLDAAQYDRIRALHERTGPELERLFRVLRTTHEELERVEAARRATDRVDFLQFHELSEAHRNARRQCRALTLDLVYAVAEVMSPEQRTRYFNLVGSGVDLGAPRG